MFLFAVAAAIVMAAMTAVAIFIRPVPNGSTKSHENRVVLVMSLIAGLAFAACYLSFAYLRTTYDKDIAGAIISMMAMLPFVAIISAAIIAFVAIPFALLFANYAPPSWKNNVFRTVPVGAGFAAMVSATLNGILLATGNPDNPFRWNMPMLDMVVSAAIAGALGAYIWWRGMHGVEHD